MSSVIVVPYGSSYLTPPPVVDISLHLKELIELIKKNNVLAKRQTPQDPFIPKQGEEMLAYHNGIDMLSQNSFQRW